MCAGSFSRWPPPSQPNGSGFNGSLSVGVINLATPLANGAAVDVRFLLGIQQTGSFKMDMNAEMLTDIGGGAAIRPGSGTDGRQPQRQDALGRAPDQHEQERRGGDDGRRGGEEDEKGREKGEGKEARAPR